MKILSKVTKIKFFQKFNFQIIIILTTEILLFGKVVCLLQQRSLTYYLGSKICITLADIVYIMIITTHMYITTKSATLTALFPLLQVITNLIANTSAPLIMNRFSSYSLLFTLQWSKTALLILLMLLFPVLSTNIVTLFIFIFSFHYVVAGALHYYTVFYRALHQKKI